MMLFGGLGAIVCSRVAMVFSVETTNTNVNSDHAAHVQHFFVIAL